jgi:hypothetical protein
MTTPLRRPEQCGPDAHLADEQVEPRAPDEEDGVADQGRRQHPGRDDAAREAAVLGGETVADHAELFHVLGHQVETRDTEGLVDFSGGEMARKRFKTFFGEIQKEINQLEKKLGLRN